MNPLANHLMQTGYVKSNALIEAFGEIDRTEFIPERYKYAAQADIPLAIGAGRVLPAPSVIGFMLELLQAERGDNVLVVGCGAGWVIALLSYIVGSNGHITSIDDSATLTARAKKGLETYSFIARHHIAEIYAFDEAREMLTESSYNRIFVLEEALGERVDLLTCLAPTGTMVLPVENIITFFQKTTEEEAPIKETFGGMPFLPFQQELTF